LKEIKPISKTLI